MTLRISPLIISPELRRKSFHNSQIVRNLLAVLVIACTALSARCEQTPTRIETVVKQTLDNIRQNGFNPSPQINDGQGGLWINWQYGSKPLMVNNGRGKVENGKPTDSDLRHDRLTDLRYLHNLLSYRSLYPSDHSYDSEIARFTKIVSADFPDGTDERGWVFFEWLDMYGLSKNAFYKTAAYNLANKLDSQFYHSEIGALYKISKNNPTGKYKPSEALGQAGALCTAGKLFNKPEWVQHGQQSAHFVIAHSYLPKHHVFLGVMTDVVAKDGSANPDESIYSAPSTHGYNIDGGNFRMGEMGDAIIGLLHVFESTADKQAGEVANAVLENMSAQNNASGLWDTKYGGYYYGYYFVGNSFKNPGELTLKTKSKEAGRQLVMLSAYHAANRLFANRYAAMEQLLTDVALNKAYYQPGHGYLYETNADWTPRDRHGVIDNYVTSEAMGCALEALLEIVRDQKHVSNDLNSRHSG